MSNTKSTTNFIRSRSNGSATIPDEVSCVFRFGKDDHHDQLVKHELIDKIEKEEKTEKQADNMTLAEAAYNAAITSIKNRLKLSSSLQVHSSDGSLISVFNIEPASLASSTSTNLEPSFDLPIGDTSFIQQILDNTSLTEPLPELDFDSDLFTDLPNDSLSTLNQLLDFDPAMTIQDLTDISLEPTEQHSECDLPSILSQASANDEITISSISSKHSEDSEHHNINPCSTKVNHSSQCKLARFGNKQVIKYSSEYHDRRIKNNEAVKKSRMKAKEKQKSTEVQMHHLTEENRLLNNRVDSLMKELQVLRSLYKELKQDSSVGPTQTLQQINTL